MEEPHVPGVAEDRLELPCGRVTPLDRFDMGMREFACECGETHAVVMDVHPLGRWIPEDVSGVLAETIEPSDEYDAFGTIHLMGMVLEEYPDRVAVHDASENPSVGWALLWVTEFDARALHGLVVELLIELMDHAVGHVTDEAVRTEFESQMGEFNVDAFVNQYRDSRDWEGRADRAG